MNIVDSSDNLLFYYLICIFTTYISVKDTRSPVRGCFLKIEKKRNFFYESKFINHRLVNSNKKLTNPF